MMKVILIIAGILLIPETLAYTGDIIVNNNQESIWKYEMFTKSNIDQIFMLEFTVLFLLLGYKLFELFIIKP